MKQKKIPYYFLLFLLTGGASLIVGFLSFGGMYALWPILPLAFGSLALSIAYEGEIYFQNITGALDKLFKRNHTENRLAREFLLKHFPESTKGDQCPQFFKDYKEQLELLHRFEHQRLTDDSQAKKEKILKTLNTMEKWFALQLFSVDTPIESHSEYENKVRNWLDTDEVRQKERKQKFTERNSSYIIYILMGIFSSVTALFMAFATTFLLGGTIELIPALTIISVSALPFIIIPMALIAGAAYGLLIYNTITDMYNNDTLRKSWNRIRSHFVEEECDLHVLSDFPHTLDQYKNRFIFHNKTLYYITEGGKKKKQKHVRDEILEKTLQNKQDGQQPLHLKRSEMGLEKEGSMASGMILAILSAVLFTLAGALTLLTAGTWWTVAQSAKPVFEWMAKLPVWVIGVLTPLFTGLSTLFFDIQNTSETLEIIDEELRAEANIFQRAINELTESFNRFKKNENWLQMFNPFRLLLVLSIAPLRIILFIGHLVSIGVTTDRVPGFSEFWMAFWGILSESFQDAHYFMDHDHAHKHEEKSGEHEHIEHKHEEKSKEHEHKHADFKDLLDERLGAKHSHHHGVDLPTKVLKLLFTPLYLFAACWAWLTSQFNDQPMTFNRAWESQNGLKKAKTIRMPEKESSEWCFEHAIYKIERHKEKQLDAASVFAKPEVAKEKARKLTELQDKLRLHDTSSPLKEQIQQAASDPCYNQHRFFGSQRTASREFLDELTNILII